MRPQCTLPALLFIAWPTAAAQAETIYVDNTSASCSGTYSVANRSCSGSDGSAYDTIQAAIIGSAVGDVIYLRGGTYKEAAIDIPESKNGTAWTVGSYTSIMSYPGEWAIVDATGLSSAAPLEAVFFHPNGYGTGVNSQYTEYWKFSNFEVTGGGSGFFIKLRNAKFHYMYIHDNGRAGVSDLQSGILSVNPQYLEIKYCWFKDNINSIAPDLNMAHIMFDADYRDNPSNGGDGESWLPDASTHHNEVAYNYFELTGANVNAAHIAIRQKNQQRFGVNSRDPNDMTSKQYGDNIHHNIVVGSRESIGVGQDFIQVHNNITDASVNIGRVAGSSSDVPQIYNAVVYNNTVKNPGGPSYQTPSGFSSAMRNYYDNGSQRTVREHVWFFNNIADGNVDAYQNVPFFLHWNMPENTTNPDADNSDLVLENNLIHNNTNTADLIVGHKFDENMFSGCDLQEHDVLAFNSCSDSWRGLAAGTVVNWKNANAGLYLGGTGADQYITNAQFELDGTTTIANGGKAGSHPYLEGVCLPAYVGATDPSDTAWVSGVLSDLTSVAWLTAQGETDPSWIERSGSCCGNGIIDSTAGEECDDGNTVDDATCNADCTLPTDGPSGSSGSSGGDNGNGNGGGSGGNNGSDGDASSEGGCGCRTVRSTRSATGLLLFMGLLPLLGYRRRLRATRPSTT